jgi:pectate lyase
MKFLPLIAGTVLLAPFSQAQTNPSAFPGAEGFGAGATGGRGGEVYFVTNLSDSGEGSLRDAVSKPNRTVIFRVSGTIELQSRIQIGQPNITVAGQTAPGDGICLRGHELFIRDTENVIVRFIRSRPGDETKSEHDAITIWNCKNVIVDHCSMSWSTDSLNDVVKKTGNVTVQWCILSEPLNNSVHVKGAHGYGTGWDGRINGGGSFHHNLIAHCNSRAPRIGYLKEGRGQIDVRNNVIYNTGDGGAYGGETDDFNYIGNYYRPGPSTKAKDVVFDIWAEDSRMFVSGNFIEGFDAINNDNRLGVKFKKGSAECLVEKPFAAAPVKTHSAKEAFELVTQLAGAVLPARDAVDQRILNDVKNGTGKIINSQSEVGGWPELKSAPAPSDTDSDGIPDTWESSHQLNPNDASDGTTITTAGYSNLEVYLNELASSAMPK